MITDGIASSLSAFGPTHESFSLTQEESARFIRIVNDSLAIRRHYHLFLWLNGELQAFLPHEILISGWGDFATGDLRFDVISALPGVRTEQLARCAIDGMVRELHARWDEQGRRPMVLKASDLPEPLLSCGCALHTALRGMSLLLTHGVRDVRGGYDSLYVALGRGPFAHGRPTESMRPLLDSLVTQIDSAFRRVAAMPRGDRRTGQGDGLELSPREQEILDYICRGKSNADVARTLDISPFTVKNHAQRIYRKIGVKNRTEAATKYGAALQMLRRTLHP